MKLTHVNVFVLWEVWNGELDAVVRYFNPTMISHLKRAIKAGAIEQTDGGWKLTAYGRQLVTEFRR